MSSDIQAILTNKEAIAIDQDPLGVQGRRVEADVWAKQLADGGRAVALLNRSGVEKRITVSWTSLGYPGHLAAQVRDLWAGRDMGSAQDSFSANVPSHGVVMITVKP
jgi:alpha-galactosidase